LALIFELKPRAPIPQNAKFGFSLLTKKGHPKQLLRTKAVGFFQFIQNEIKSSFFYEKTSAPVTGYLREYKLKGNKEGFFVLCRDGRTYGKLIFDKSEIDHSAPDDKGGFYKDFGKQFSCLYQPNGTTDLSYSTPDLDLESFLVDHSLR
jgi:hypothetical protein